MAKTTRTSSKARRAPTKTGANTRRTTTRTTKTARPKGRTGNANVTLREKTLPKDAPNTIGGMPMRTLTPQLVVGDANAAIAWYVKVLGAKELDRRPLPNGKIMHAVLRIGDTGFMISDSFGPAPDELNGAFIHVQDKGIDAIWQRAVSNGATTILPLANQFWGDKYGQLRDPFGQVWSFGWPAKMTQAEKDRLQREAMQQMSATPPATR
jgi:PhnB protein